MISHELRCIFIHIPRTAGSSVEVALTGKDWWEVSPGTKHLSARAARRKYGSVWDRYYKFTFVRNPWDRIVSAWESPFYERQRKRWPSFKSFVANIRANPGEQREFFMHRILDKTPDSHLSWYERLIRSRAGGARARVDFIGYYERLQEDFAHVCRQLGIPPRELPIQNQSRERRPYQSYYDEETRDIVRRRFEFDISLFGYEWRDEST